MSNTNTAVALEVTENKQVTEKPAKAKPVTISFSKDYAFNVESIQKSLEKMRGDMGRYRQIAEKHGLFRTARDIAGDNVKIIPPEMASKLRSAGLITSREAEDIRVFSAAIKGLEGIMSYESRKAAEVAKLKVK